MNTPGMPVLECNDVPLLAFTHRDEHMTCMIYFWEKAQACMGVR